MEVENLIMSPKLKNARNLSYSLQVLKNNNGENMNQSDYEN